MTVENTMNIHIEILLNESLYAVRNATTIFYECR